MKEISTKTKTLDFGTLFVLLLIFALSPIVGLVTSFLFFTNRRESLWIFALFTAYWGLCMVPIGEANDLAKYFIIIVDYANWAPTDLQNYFTSYLEQKNIGNVDVAATDLYLNVVAYFTTRFTRDPHIIMMVFGLVLGILYSMSISLFQKANIRFTFISLLIIISFSFCYSLADLGGIRFVTASYIFFYGASRFIVEKKWKFFLVAALSALTHFSFMMLIPLLLFLRYFGKHSKILIVIYSISFVIPLLIDAGFISNYGGDFGIAKKITSYEDQENNNKMVSLYSERSLFMTIKDYIQYYFSILLFYIVFAYRKFLSRLVVSDKAKAVLSLSLLILTLSNALSFIHILRFRFMPIAFMFGYYFIYILHQDNVNSKLAKRIAIIAILIAFFQITAEMQRIIGHSSEQLFFGNFFTYDVNQ